MKPIRPVLPFLHCENAPVAERLVEEAMRDVAETLADCWGKYHLDFYDFCRAVKSNGKTNSRAVEIAIRRHQNENRLTVVKRTKPEKLYDQESGEFVGTTDIEVFYVVANDSLWSWQETQHETVLHGPKTERPPNRFQKKNVNARMLEAMLQDPQRQGWTCRQWAEYLKCSKASVVATEAWRHSNELRDRTKAEMATSQRLRKTPKAWES